MRIFYQFVDDQRMYLEDDNGHEFEIDWAIPGVMTGVYIEGPRSGEEFILSDEQTST